MKTLQKTIAVLVVIGGVLFYIAMKVWYFTQLVAKAIEGQMLLQVALAISGVLAGLIFVTLSYALLRAARRRKRNNHPSS